MENKMFELMEKMYIEFSSFKTDITSEIKGIRQDLNGVKEDLNGIRQDLNGVKKDVKSLDIKVDKNTMLLENLTNKVETIAEVQKSHMGQNEKAHKDIVKNLTEKIDMLELAVKDISKNVEEIQENLEPLCEDMIVVKSVVKIISGDIADLSDKIEFIEMKEFNNERELFMIKKKLTQ